MPSLHSYSSVPPTECRDIPQAPGPEKSILALMVMDPATYMAQAVTFGLTDDYFYIPAHKLLWRLDIISITQALDDMQQLDSVGGSAGLADV